jgi:uncharacterized protein YggE
MQHLERPWGVVVRGTASVTAEPDLARLSFRIVRVEQSPAAAFDAVNAAVARVRTALSQHGLPDEAVRSSRLDLATEYSYVDGGRRFAGHRCQARFAVESSDLDDVEALLVDLVEAGANEIDAVQFDVSATAELRVEARRQAVAAGRARAEEYASAAGARLGAILHIEDADPERMMEKAFDEGAASPLAAGLAPGGIGITASVMLAYAIVH